MTATEQDDVFAQGYAASGRERHDLIKAVQTLQEFVQRYKAERDECREQVRALNERIKRRDALAKGRHDDKRKWKMRALEWRRRAGQWKEAARAYRDVLMLFYHPRNVPYMLRLGRKYRKARA